MASSSTKVVSDSSTSSSCSKLNVTATISLDGGVTTTTFSFDETSRRPPQESAPIPHNARYKNTDDAGTEFVLKKGNVYSAQVETLECAKYEINKFLTKAVEADKAKEKTGA